MLASSTHSVLLSIGRRITMFIYYLTDSDVTNRLTNGMEVALALSCMRSLGLPLWYKSC